MVSTTGRCDGLGPDLSRDAFEAHDAAGLGELQHGLLAGNARHQAVVAFAGIERQQILRRSQHDIGSLERLAKDCARDIQVRPAPRAEIGVEGNAGAPLPRARLSAAINRVRPVTPRIDSVIAER